MTWFYRYGRKFAVAFSLYVIVCLMSLWLQEVTQTATQIWPAAGMALALVIKWDRRIWPAFFFGSIFIHLIHGDVPEFLGAAIGNSIEPLLGAWLCTKDRKFDPSLKHPRDILRLLVGAAFVSTFAGTLVAVPWLMWWRGEGLDVFYFAQFWAGDSLGVLMAAPVILVFTTPTKIARFDWKNLRGSEGIAFVFLLALVVTLFVRMEGPIRLYFFFPLLLWAAVRMGQRGATLVSGSIALAAVLVSAAGSGPFSPLGESLQADAYLWIFVATLQITGLIFASVAMGREIDRIARESSLRKTQERLEKINLELEESLRVRDEFLSIASHELRTPMTPLRLNFQMIQRIAGQKPDAPGGELLCRRLLSCERSLLRLTRLIDELLSVSRIRAGKMTLVVECVDLSKLTREVVKQYEGEFERMHSTPVLDVEDGVVGMWDLVKIEEVLVNLVTNALKFGKGAPVEIRVSRVGETARLEVKDHGIGIPLEDQKRIFLRFERAVSARHFGGLGLGLYIVNGIVEAHEGKIGVHSQPGMGSTFTIDLPLRPASASAPEAAAS